MNSFTQLCQMYKQILHRLNKAESIQELTRFFVLFGLEELKEIIRNKLNIEIEKGQKSESNIDFFSVQNKIRDTYLCTASFDEILPTTVLSHILSFLNHNSFADLSILSRSFWRTFSLNPILFKKYTLEFSDSEERKLNIFKLEKRRRKNFDYQVKPKKLQVIHISQQVMIGIRSPRTLIYDKSDENMNTMDRLGKFPWNGIRKWYVNGILFETLYSCFAQRPVSLYRSVFDTSSDSDWRRRVLGWKKFIDNEIDLFDLLHYNDMMGANHGCIYYSLSLSAKDLQFKETSYSTQRCQMKQIDDQPYFLKRFTWINAKRICKYTADRSIFCIKDEYLDRQNVLSSRCLNECSPFQNNDWKGSEKDLRKYILALGKVDDKTTKNLIEQVQYFYDHILCLREWLESLYCTSDKFRFGQCSFTEFEIEINGEQIELVIHKNEEKKTKEVNIYDWSDCNDDNNSSADNNASI
ncbi:hypothetical protein RFI_31265, partial [Reticulomyxa filosa]